MEIMEIIRSGFFQKVIQDFRISKITIYVKDLEDLRNIFLGSPDMD